MYMYYAVFKVLMSKAGVNINKDQSLQSITGALGVAALVLELSKLLYVW